MDREIGNANAQIAKARATIDCYFEAFEAETMKPEVCMENVDDLNVRLEQLEDEKRDLEERRQHLDLPAPAKEMFARLVDNFDEVMAAGTNPQKRTSSAIW